MWIIDAAGEGMWREVHAYPGKPDHLAVRMRFAPTGDGVAVAGVQVERTDGRALTARDMREVRLPPNWVLFGETAVRWYQPGGPQASRSRRGPKGDDDGRDRMVWDLYRQAAEVAPRAPVRWMLPQLGVSDATARRWIARARKRAAELGWPDARPGNAGNRHPRRCSGGRSATTPPGAARNGTGGLDVPSTLRRQVFFFRLGQTWCSGSHQTTWNTLPLRNP